MRLAEMTTKPVSVERQYGTLLFSMSSRADISAANIEIDALRRQLVAHWEKTLDENGNFDHVFGNPLLTPYAVRIWVGYDEDEEVKVDIVYPASEDALVAQEETFSERDLKTLESVAHDNANLLDTDVPQFACIIREHLAGYSHHESFEDPLWTAWLNAKQKNASATASYKQQMLKNAEKERELSKEFVELSFSEYVSLSEAHKLVYDEKKRLHDEKQLAAQRKAEAEANSRPQVDARIEAGLSRLYSTETGFLRYNQDDPFVQYLERAFGLGSSVILYQNMELASIPIMVSAFVHVQEVNLSQNNLVKLPPQLFAMPKLKRLYLHSNLITSLPPTFAYATSPLEILDLHNNLITQVPQLLGTLTRLQSLDLENNKLKAVPDDIAALTQSLQHLNLASNEIKTIPHALGHFHALTYLNLKNNPIIDLPSHIYQQGTAATLKHLRELIPHASAVSGSLVHDISHLLTTLVVDGKPILADLILQSNGKDSTAPVEKDEEISNFQQTSKTGLPFVVHSAIIAARSSSLRSILMAVKQKGIVLETHPSLGLPVLPLNVSSEQLAVLLTYFYSDQYVKRELPLSGLVSGVPEAAAIEAKQLQVLKQHLKSSLLRASATALRFKLPHLQYLVDQHLSVAHPAESTYVEEVKRLLAASGSRGAFSLVCPFDVTFSFPDFAKFPPVHAHKAVLCARSPYLRALLTGGMLEATQRVVEISEISPVVFKSVVEFCYSDDVAQLDADTIMELLKIAKQYQLEKLTTMVEGIVGYSLDTQNVCGIMTTASILSLPKLARACKFYVLANWKAVTRTEAWKETPKALKDKLAEAAEQWGAAAPKDEKTSSAPSSSSSSSN